MRICNIQHFTVMMTTVVVLAYAASVHHPKKEELIRLLEGIRDETEHLLKRKHSENVTKIFQKKCEAHQFCLAEKALNKTPEFLERLKRTLHQYNIKKENGTTCPNPSNNHTCSLDLFLKDLMICVNHALNKLLPPTI